MSFKRKTTSKQPNFPPGTRLSPSSLSTTITSTGIPSLDDILGGGLPLSCSLLVLAPDSHSAYGELVQKYFIAQGLACGQTVYVIGDNAKVFVEECMWLPGAAMPVRSTEDDEDEKASQHDDKIKIAWRYEQMKKFQTTVSSSTSSMEDYCRTFDLTCRIPVSIVQDALQSGDLVCPDTDSVDSTLSLTRLIQHLEELLLARAGASGALRLCFPSFGSPQQGNSNPQDILYFLASLRRLLRQHPFACASVSLSSHICNDNWGGAGWIQKLGWLSDAAITMSAFTANPSLAAIFPTHHGLLHIHTLPAPHTILPSSDKFSTLRGLSSSAVSTGGSGENNLAFKCMRKRLIFETLHLDLEGGVGERRTTPSANAMALDLAMTSHDHDHHDHVDSRRNAESATVQVEVVIGPGPNVGEIAAGTVGETPQDSGVKMKKAKKKVAFHSDRPDLYDF